MVKGFGQRVAHAVDHFGRQRCKPLVVGGERWFAVNWLAVGGNLSADQL